MQEGTLDYLVLPPALTGVVAPIAVLSGSRFPTGSRKPSFREWTTPSGTSGSCRTRT